jgi:hypothetical protein
VKEDRAATACLGGDPMKLGIENNKSKELLRLYSRMLLDSRFESINSYNFQSVKREQRIGHEIWQWKLYDPSWWGLVFEGLMIYKMV